MLFAARSGALAAKGVFQPISREGALVFNNVLLAVSAFVVFVGTVWPLVAEIFFDTKMSVGPPFFDAAFTPFMVALAIILPVGALLPWKRGRISRAMAPLWGVLILAIAIGALVWTMQTGRTILAPIGAVLGAWLVFGAMAELWTRGGRGSPSSKLRRILRLPRADWGKAVAHAGFGITTFGVAALTAWTVEDIRVAQEGETWTVGRYDVTLNSVDRVEGPNYLSTMAQIEVVENGRSLGVLTPEKRVYPVAGMPTTEAAIDNGFTRDVYVVIGDPQDNGGWAVRTFIKPYANWIWAGAIVMALGGLLSLTDRRFRVAAGARKTPNPQPVAAE